MNHGRCRWAVQIDLDTIEILARFWGLDRRTGLGGEAKDWSDIEAGAMERFRRLVDETGTRATVFVTGRSLEVAGQAAIIRLMAREGHEIANHTQDHPADLTALGAAAIERQIGACGEAIERVTGSPPSGFRAPCYRVDGEVITLLERMGYSYDASVLGSPAVIAMKGVHALLARPPGITSRGGEQTGDANGWGGWSGPGCTGHMLAPRGMYHPSRTDPSKPGDRRSIIEVPISTVTPARVPMNSTSLLPLPAVVAEALVKRRSAASGFATFTFHLVDLVDGRELPGWLALRHPMTGMPLGWKIGRCRGLLAAMGCEGEGVTTRQMAQSWMRPG